MSDCAEIFRKDSSCCYEDKQKDFLDFTSENPAKSGKNRIKPENHISTYYQHVICHFSWLDHGEVNFDTYFEIFWKKIYQKKIWRIFWINLIFFPNFWHILTFFGVFGCIMIIRISRWNFPNFLSILGDFPTKFKIFNGFWLFLKFGGMLGLNGYQDKISQIFSQFWGIFQQI